MLVQQTYSMAFQCGQAHSPQNRGCIVCSSITTWFLYCHMHPQLAGESLPKKGSYPQSQFLQCCCATGVSQMDDRIKLCNLPGCICAEFLWVQEWNRGLGKNPSSIPQQLEFARLLIQLIFRSHYCIFPRAKRVRASCYVWLHCLSSPLNSVGLFGWLLVVFCFYFNLLQIRVTFGREATGEQEERSKVVFQKPREKHVWSELYQIFVHMGDAWFGFCLTCFLA